MRRSLVAIPALAVETLCMSIELRLSKTIASLLVAAVAVVAVLATRQIKAVLDTAAVAVAVLDLTAALAVRALMAAVQVIAPTEVRVALGIPTA